MDLLEQIGRAVEEGHPNETRRLVESALNENVPASDILEQAMAPAMRRVGEYYKKNEADIPRILTAARSLRCGFELIESCCEDYQHHNIGTVIVGTVEGDLHDVGKNLVALMFRSAGFRVIDLGVDISEKQFLEAVKKNPEVSVVCISSLLSTTLPEMKQVVKTLRRKDPDKRYKIMVGGGAVSKEIADQMGADAYTENAVDAAELAKTFMV